MYKSTTCINFFFDIFKTIPFPCPKIIFRHYRLLTKPFQRSQYIGGELVWIRPLRISSTLPSRRKGTASYRASCWSPTRSDTTRVDPSQLKKSDKTTLYVKIQIIYGLFFSYIYHTASMFSTTINCFVIIYNRTAQW